MEQVMLNLLPIGSKSTCHVSQYDVGRVVRFNLMNGALPYNLTGTEDITIKIRKPSGTEVVKSVPNTSDTYVDWTTADGDCDEAGKCECELSITQNSVVIGTKNFTMKVEADPYDGEGIVTETAGPAPIATFETNIVDLLQEVKCSILATGGNGTPDNPNPIVGYSLANITRCGVNLMHVNSRVSQTTAGVTYTSDDNYISLNGTKSGGGYADMSNLTMTLPRGTYYLKAFVISGTASNTVSLYAFDGANNISSDILGGEKTMTLTETTTFCFHFAIWRDGTVCTNYKVGIVISTASISEYSEYNGQTYTIAFGQTVYGGQLDVTRGKLHVTTARLDLSDLNYSYNTTAGVAPYFYASISGVKYEGPFFSTVYNSKCNIYTCTKRDRTAFVDKTYCFDGSAPTVSQIQIKDLDYTDPATFKASLTGAYIIYELATPFNIDLTPVQIEQLLGKNNVWHDANGDTEVKYLYNA